MSGMHRQRGISFTSVFLQIMLASFLAGQCGAGARDLGQPNFLPLLADDMTYTDMGAAGNPDVKTPNLDLLASQGMRFRYFFNSVPMCAPTRMALYTGIHPVRNGAYPNHS